VSSTNAFRIASITKQFTAAAILQLVEQGRLKLTESVERFYNPSRRHSTLGYVSQMAFEREVA
jgi:putative transposase